ncbi:MAG: hypothetical protein A2902_04625 [Elusimicrobia bacterium RIFCSPLOWO2_01_FULL_64_13]|nr:MAG: hypothetical protein A2636_03315 [Elusimicrobia bacterium RIFCSPHIGHO2_01_FULL_64_10]OGR97821.1 MAG: hypothetical protein A2902_04625 [Elusimicrobia bacterium RIFCSPLOWO2_01_FULL_64_13]
MNRKIIAATGAAFLALAGCKGKAKEGAELGRAYFQGMGCVRCHRIGGEGGRVGPDLTLVGFRKSRDWLDTWLENPPAWKKNTIMPNFHLQADMRRAIVDYLASLKGQDYGDKRPWMAPEFDGDPVRRGEALFKGAGCATCHGLKGAGGYPNNNVVGGKIPALTYAADGYSKEELKERIRNGKVPDKADPNGTAPLLVMPPWGEVLNEDEIDAVADYVLSLRPAGAEDWE